MVLLLSFIRGGFLALYAHVARRQRLYQLTLIGVEIVVAWMFFVPPLSFQQNVLIEIPEGASVVAIAEEFEEQGLISSPFLLKVLFKVTSSDDDVQAGPYLFTHPVGLVELWYRLSHGISGIGVISITLPEGFTTRQMADRFDKNLPEFDKALFLEQTQLQEGYLFPDTYAFIQTATTDDVIQTLSYTFTKKLESLNDEILAFGRPVHDVVTMASLLEREGKTLEDRQMIAGILWKRVDEGMALQVDAVFGYIFERETFHPSFEDLEIDSPYNTYTNPGLPPGPIANPGLESLRAAVTPTESEYWYYLTGDDGTMHYATTFEEHKENKAQYLK